MLRSLLIAALAATALAGCSRDGALNCEPADRYATARSAPPVRVPDDLSVPDESASLRLPPAAVADSAAVRCLETPPDFFENRRVGAPDAAEPDTSPAPQAEPEVATDPERQISN
jgi:predicted small lipoprotein YifL